MCERVLLTNFIDGYDRKIQRDELAFREAGVCQGVTSPAPSGGTPGRHVHGCLLSPSGHRAEHEVARSWTNRSSRPKGHRPSGQEHERAGSTSRDVWAPTRELAFGRYPLRAVVGRWYEKYAAGPDRKYDEANQGERGDPLRSGQVRQTSFLWGVW